MAADVQIRFRADSQSAKREINQLTKEVRELRRGMEQTQRTAAETTQTVNRLGVEVKETAISGDTSSQTYKNLNKDISRRMTF